MDIDQSEETVHVAATFGARSTAAAAASEQPQM
jgi:hypothetical protein